jgi:hypothetical protein
VSVLFGAFLVRAHNEWRRRRTHRSSRGSKWMIFQTTRNFRQRKEILMRSLVSSYIISNRRFWYSM